MKEFDEEVRLIVGVPSSGSTPMGFTYCLSAFIAYTCHNGIPSCPGVHLEMDMAIQEGSSIHQNREKIVMDAIECGATHLLFLDHDMAFQSTILDRLFSRRKPIVVTNYVFKQDHPPEWVAVSLDNERIPVTDDAIGIEPVAASGFGVSLFDLKVFETIPQPWFAPEWLPKGKRYTTEDYPFFRRARKAGHEVWLDHDASRLITGHIGTKIYRWQQWTRKGEGVAK